MGVLAQIVAWLNALADLVGRLLLGLIGVLPGWLSATIISAVTGVLLLWIFKYTSPQRSIKRVRDSIKANLLAVKLFKDSPSVAFRSQGRILAGAFWLMVFSVVPMLVMIVPVCLMLGQLGLWYQARPLRVGEEAVVTLKLNGGEEAPLPDVGLAPTSAAEVTSGPVEVPSLREVSWRLKAREDGYHRLVFHVDQQAADKELAVGDGFMRVSMMRPGWDWTELLMHPWEPAFRPDSPVESITIAYPNRDAWTCGTDWWIAYWFGLSMVAALCFRPFLDVNI